MAITATPYGNFLVNLGQGGHDLVHSPVMVALLTSGYTPNFATDYDFNAVQQYELPSDSSNGGYQTYGNPVNYKSFNYDSSGNVATLNAADVTWDALTGTFRYAVLLDAYYGVTSSRMCGLLNFGTDRTYNSEAFSVQFPAGVMTISGA